MKVVVIGGTGLIGKKLTDMLRNGPHEITAASPSLGVDTLTGKGLDAALEGSQIVIDVSNSPQFSDQAVWEFFETSTRNLLAAAKRAGINHVVVLSIVGTDRLKQGGYFHAKLAQEDLIRASGLPYSIIRSTQFFEFIEVIAASGVKAHSIELPPVAFQPIAAIDVVHTLSEIVRGVPLNGILEIAGPERSSLTKLVQHYLNAVGSKYVMVPNLYASYFGAQLTDQSLLPGPGARVGATFFETWLAKKIIATNRTAKSEFLPLKLFTTQTA